MILYVYIYIHEYIYIYMYIYMYTYSIHQQGFISHCSFETNRNHLTEVLQCPSLLAVEHLPSHGRQALHLDDL